MLEVENLKINYGEVKAVRGISFEVNQGEIVTIIDLGKKLGLGTTEIDNDNRVIILKFKDEFIDAHDLKQNNIELYNIG